MENLKEILPFVLIGAALTQIAYLAFNVYRQKKAEKKLEILIKNHENEFHKMLESYKIEKRILHLTGENAKSTFDDLILMTFVKNQINQLKSDEKIMMNKVIDRKNTENQIRYIHKLISDIGFDSLLSNQKKTSLNL